MGEGRAGVGAFEGTLDRADFNEFGGGELYGTGAVEAEVVVVFGVVLRGGVSGLAWLWFEIVPGRGMKPMEIVRYIPRTYFQWYVP